MCPSVPHILEAYNHKVNHDTHKELTTQEHAVVQYTRVLQYTSFCNDKRYKDRLAPAVYHFWDKVVKPFGSRALSNLHHSHLLGDCMCPNHGAKILDYGVWEHIAFVCMPFFEGIESHLQYKRERGKRKAVKLSSPVEIIAHAPSARGQEPEG